jgi:hypothetical protein
MKRLLPVVILAAAAFLGFRYFGSSGPERVYRKFAEEVVQRNYAAAAAMCDGLSADDLSRLGTQEHIGAGPAMFQKLFPSRFTIESSGKRDDGSVDLEAVQTVYFNPVGVESAIRPAMFATMRQHVTMRKKDGAWKVAAFENAFQSMDNVPKR